MDPSADCDQERSVPEDAPLRFGEFLAISAMMPDFAYLPLEHWSRNRSFALSSNGTPFRTGLGRVGRAFTRAPLRFAKFAVATFIAVVTWPGSAED